MKLFYTIVIAITLITIAVFSKSSWISNIPNGGVNSCMTCHPNGNGHQFNSFGNASKSYLSGGKIIWGAEFAALDSDGDGFTNGEELQDPNGVWKIGDPAPGQVTLVTHPGDASSHPITSYVEDQSLISGIKINPIYPNPVTDNSKLELSLSKSGYLKIELFDYTGYLHTTLYQGNSEIGEYNLNISALSVSNSGQLFLKISLNGYCFVRKILILK